MLAGVTPIDIDTPHGPARAHLHRPDGATTRGALVLGHGAGGSVDAPDLVAVRDVARALGCVVALVEQPYRVAGRRSAPPAPQLDAAWVAVLAHLRAGALANLRVVVGGRSSGARVACRTAAAVGAAGVLCLAFPLLAPPRRSTGERVSRLPELAAVDVPVLVVQGENDRFGRPPQAPGREVVVVAGDHGLKRDTAAVAAAASAWLGRVLA